MARDEFEANFSGFDELRGKMRYLADENQSKVSKFASRKAAAVVADHVGREVATVDDSSTAEDIQENVAFRESGRHFKRTGDVKFRIGIQGGAANDEGRPGPGGHTFYWRFLNFGTRFMSSSISLERAAQRAESEAFNTFRIQFGKALERAVKRAKKARS